MDNAELERRLSQAEEGDEASGETRIETARYLVFHVEGKRYALPSGMAREILIDSPIYSVPFVPPYVRGLINRHGEPYTSFDLSMFLSQRHIEGTTHLVLNVNGDQVALLVSDVVEILEVPIADILEISASQDSESWYSGSFTLDETEVLILNLEGILSRLRSEVGRE